jgi:hypothetical protein
VPLCPKRGPKKERQEQRWQVVRMLAYRCVVLADGWQLLCSELHLNPDVLAQDLPGYEAVQQTVQAARFVAFNAEEARGYRRDHIEASRPASSKRSRAGREY